MRSAAEVEWVEAADNHVAVHAADGSGLLREPLKSLEARLDPARFARVHRIPSPVLLMNIPARGSLTSVGQIAIVAQNVPRATAFYRDVLGLPVLFAAPGPDGAPALAFFDAGGVRLMLSANERPADGGAAPGTSVVYYRTADLDRTYETVVARGAAAAGAPHLIARMPDHELWMAFVRDSEGNLVGLMSERPPGGAGA